MPRRGRSNTMARRYKGRPDTFRTDLVLVVFTILQVILLKIKLRSCKVLTLTIGRIIITHAVISIHAFALKFQSTMIPSRL